MIIDAWMQHPSADWIGNPMFDSLRRWKPGKWSVIDVLSDHFSGWGVPVLGGLPVGHGPHPPTIPLGTMATLDTAALTLTIDPGVC